MKFIQNENFRILSNDAKVFITRLPSFIIPKLTVVWHVKQS